MATAENGSDPFHRLPRPMPRTAPGSTPFVGNATLDDNIAESARVALWTAIGGAQSRIHVTVEDGQVTLSGTLASPEESAACEAAVRALPEVRGVDNRIRVVSTSGFPGTAAGEPEQMLSVTRYCSLEPPSLLAAVADARRMLDAVVTATKGPAPRDLVLVFRNRRDGTVTVDVGYPVPPGYVAAEGEIQLRQVPAGPMISTVPEPGVPGLLAAAAALETEARDTEASSIWFWQRIVEGALEPWDATAPIPVNAPAGPAPRHSEETG